MNYRYTLQSYSGIKSRFRCPNCHKTNKFSRYIDTETNEYIHEIVGRCNREIKCGYHYTPKQYFGDHHFEVIPKRTKIIVSNIKENPTSTIQKAILTQSLKKDAPNNFLEYLGAIFDTETVNKLKTKYHIGTSKKWKGATVFWQMDCEGKIRSGKVMLYNVNTGKRIKKPYHHITWVHRIMKISNYTLKQCFFGEHLLKATTNPIAIVESEKTAIIASVFLPEFTWIASGSLSNLNHEKTKILKDRQVILFPDLGGYDKWKEKILKLCPDADYQISDLLERKASDKQRELGLDVADYLLALELEKYVNN
ncbi:DUF6371 domain-containing protein [Aquimarina mytili]|uniref:Uncharacterized protein n=1 Tax=Aquimarina mytili TaxID=874423 RepID=A0A937DBJ7_9FLAO|nr:DUF6371 domain-containing protein [Aquimarina mytili]MBL0683906.1 hypothetical protein [Aquimarina mytili]